MKPPLRRLAVSIALAFALQLTLPPAAVSAPKDVGLRFGDWLGFLSRLWAPEGCSIDPGGRCTVEPKQVVQNNGCSFDPHGGCRESDATTPAPRDNGCIFDPGGLCAN